MEEVEPVDVTTNEYLGTKNRTAEQKLGVEGRKKNSDKGKNWRKVKEGVPLKHAPYPHAPSRREAECQFIRFTKILKLSFREQFHRNLVILGVLHCQLQ